MTVQFPRFEPATVPQDPADLPRYIQDMFNDIANAINVVRDGHIDVIYSAPTKPQQGDIRYADGTSWNPGSGEGLYLYNSAGAWVQL